MNSDVANDFRPTSPRMINLPRVKDVLSCQVNSTRDNSPVRTEIQDSRATYFGRGDPGSGTLRLISRRVSRSDYDDASSVIDDLEYII